MIRKASLICDFWLSVAVIRLRLSRDSLAFRTCASLGPDEAIVVIGIVLVSVLLRMPLLANLSAMVAFE